MQKLRGVNRMMMIALAGVGFLIFLLVIGSGLVISAAVGLIACKKTDGRNGKKSRLIFIFKILLWILLGGGVVVTAVLRVALPLYLLNETGSAALFGVVFEKRISKAGGITGMKNNHKSRLKHLWNRVMADAKMDNATKARIAEKTVRDAVTGLQKMLNPDEYFRKQ